MNNILVSIIVPVYNGEKYIKNCIDRIKEQTYKNIELIIINDGSTDNTEEIIKKYNFNNLKHIIINKKNSGVSDSRNLGIKKSTGKYITFLDVDDELTSDAISYYMRIITVNKCDAVRGNYVLKYKDKFKRNKEKNKEKLYAQFEMKNLRLNLYRGNFNGFGCLFFIKRKLLIDNNIYFPKEMSFMEDFVFISNLFKYAKSVFFSSKIMYLYIQNNDSASHSTNIDKRLCNIDYKYKNTIEYIRSNNFSKETICDILNQNIYILLKTQYYIINNYKIDKNYKIDLDKDKIYNRLHKYLSENGMELRQMDLKNKILFEILKIKNKKLILLINKLYMILKGE